MIFLMMVIWNFPFPGETKIISEDTRSTLPGKTCRLSDGITYYEETGAIDAPVLLLVHGFSVPSFIWNPTYEYFSGRDYRVIRFDLFGRGYSDRPEKKNNMEFFVTQLEGLINTLEIRKPITIIGLSMGGLISLFFAVKNPKLVKELVLIDPAGFEVQLPKFVQLLRTPLIGEVLLALIGNIGLVRGNAGGFLDPALIDGFIDKFRNQLDFKGYKASILSTLRNGVLDDNIDLYESYGSLGKRLLLIWGMEDTIIPFEHHRQVMDLIPTTEFCAVEEIGHIPHYEKPEIVNTIIEDFISV